MKIDIGVLGAGSLGTLIGGLLASIKEPKYSLNIHLFCRPAHAEAINKKGLIFKEGDKKINISNIQAHVNSQGCEKIEFRYIFLTTKAYDINSVLTQYKDLLGSCKWLVIFQNGIGNEDIVKESVPKERIIRGVTTNGALLIEPGHVAHTGPGFTKIGYSFLESRDLESEEDLDLLNELLNSCGLNCSISEDIIKDCWEKVFVNVGINPFGALTGLRNGDLLKNSTIKSLMAQAVEEAIIVAKKREVKLSNSDFIERTYDVATKAAENKNSMLQDVLKAKRTEIDFINGKIVSYAEELGIKVPVNELLTALVRGLEASYREESSDFTVMK